MMKVALALLLCAVLANGSSVSVEANPIRKVVNILKEMQKEIEAEGEAEKELFEKFMCFCNGGEADLAKTVSDSKLKITELEAKLKQETADKEGTVQELADHKTDREGAKKELAESAELRSKENAEFKEFSGDTEANIKAMAGAIPALEKGMGGGASLLQVPSSIPTSVIQRITQLAEAAPSISDLDRKHLTGFLQQTGDYVPASGQIVGILKQMQDEMTANLKEAVSEEETAAKTYADLKASKEESVQLASTAIESKTVRNGELAVSIVQTKDSLEDTKIELADAEKFLANLKTQCETKQKEWDERCKARSEEIAAVSDAIGILNDDDALEIFKKTMPSAALLSENTAFLQRSRSSSTALQRAQAIVAHVASEAGSQPMKLLLFSLNSKVKLERNGGKAGGFEKVIEIIDKLVGVLAKDQAEDDEKKEWCGKEFDTSDDEQKRLKNELSDLSATIKELGDGIVTLGEEIAALEAGIVALDKTVVEATEQRKEEHAEYVSTMQMNQAAVDLVGKARNRLSKVYAPELYKPPSFLQVVSRAKVEPPQAPETFSGEVQKNQKSGGVLAMMDQISKDLKSDMQTAEYDEKQAQKDYMELMTDSKESRKSDVQSISDKEAAKAQLKGELDEANESSSNTQAELGTVQTYINQLHGQCDFLLQNYGVRKEARAKERDGLTEAKAMLSGAR